jgi:threonine 3-dehydrogenase
MESMQAVVKPSPEAPPELRRVPIPRPGAGEVLVRVRATAICGTDVHIAEWDGWARGAGITLPLVMGHEFCGEVTAVGAEVRGLAPGDYVAGETHIACGTCFQCRHGLAHICRHLKLFGIHCQGSFAEYAVLPGACAVRISPAIPPRVAAVLEPLGTSLRAALEVAPGGETVAVTGCGPIGLFAIAAARALGAARIIATDVLDDRLALAGRMGADVALHAGRADVLAEVLRLTDGVGVDAVIEASGSVPAIQQAFACLRKGGKVALIGLPSAPAPLQLGSAVVFKEAHVVGVHGRDLFRTWTQMEALLAAGRLQVEPAITHELPLEAFAEGFHLLEEGKGSKVLLHP